MLFGSCQFVLSLSWSWIRCLLGAFALTPRCLVEAYGCSKYQVLIWRMVPEWMFSPTTIFVNLYPSSEENPSCGVEPPRGGNPYSRIGFAFASDWGKSHQRSCEAEIWEGEILASESDLWVGEITQQSVLNGHREACVIASEWRKSHIGTYRPSIGSN